MNVSSEVTRGILRRGGEEARRRGKRKGRGFPRPSPTRLLAFSPCSRGILRRGGEKARKKERPRFPAAFAHSTARLLALFLRNLKHAIRRQRTSVAARSRDVETHVLTAAETVDGAAEVGDARHLLSGHFADHIAFADV